MQVHFWGTRGSLASSITADTIRVKIRKAIKESNKYHLETDRAIETFIDQNLPFSVRATYGTNTSCIQIKGGNDYVICDAGTGLRDFGNSVLSTNPVPPDGPPCIFHIFISHLHWDHIQGFPFFMPAYIAGNRVNIYGFHKELKQGLASQQDTIHFPVTLHSMKANITFNVLELEKEYDIAGLKVRGLKQNHPGDSYGYCFEKDGKKIVYSTDAEHGKEAESEQYPFIHFVRKADLLIFDAQYPLVDALHTKENWGHSSNIIAVELAVRAQVKRLCLFHSEHTYDDEILEQSLQDTRDYLRIHTGGYPFEIDLAYDGLEIEV